MDALEAIFTRRSIRKYAKGTVPGPVVTELLKAAMAAPSAGNKQPWHFVVIDDRQILERVITFHPSAEMLHETALGILICGDESLEKGKGYFPLDCSAAAQNVLLAAHAKGLGAVWLGIYPRQDRIAGMRELVGVPEGIVPFALISIGLPAEKAGPVERFDAGRVHRNRW
ncbi:MAG: nitroreductase family protein [Pseudomonadota bacterium]